MERNVAFLAILVSAAGIAVGLHHFNGGQTAARQDAQDRSNQERMTPNEELKTYRQEQNSIHRRFQLCRFNANARTLHEVDQEIKPFLGMAMLREQRYQDALAVLRRALELQPESAVAHLNVGITLADLLLKEEAVKEFEEASRLSPQMAEAHYNLGRALYELRRFEKARASLERATSLRSDYGPALMMLGMTESSLGRPEKSVELLKRSLALGWSDTTAHYKPGRALLDVGRENDAVAHLEKAVELDPANNQAVFALMRVISAVNPTEAKQYG